MAITVKLNTRRQTKLAPQPYTAEAVDLMRAIKLRERLKAAAVTNPGEVFAVLLGLGYAREDQMDIQSQAREFVGTVRSMLETQGRKIPSYDEVLSVMGELGYRRAAAA
ncbi:MAG: hypothetical protein AB8G99_19600 [Planctomycetaceae bacterium]